VIWILVNIGWLFLLGLILHDAVRDERQNEKWAERNHNDAPIAIGSPEYEETEQQKHRAIEREHWAREQRHNWRVIVFSAATATAAIVAAVIAWFAYSEAWRQAAAAWEQVKISRDTEERQIRAYLGVFAGAIEPQHSDEGDAIGVRVTIRNAGTTPAYDERSWIAVRITAPTAVPFIFPPNLDDRPKSVVGPNTDFDLDVGFATTPEIIQLVHDNKAKIFVWGRGEYRDAFGHDRFLVFRMTNGSFVPGNNRWTVSPHPSGYEAN
jgi:hypothetical protein